MQCNSFSSSFFLTRFYDILIPLDGRSWIYFPQWKEKGLDSFETFNCNGDGKFNERNSFSINKQPIRYICYMIIELSCEIYGLRFKGDGHYLRISLNHLYSTGYVQKVLSQCTGKTNRTYIIGCKWVPNTA